MDSRPRQVGRAGRTPYAIPVAVSCNPVLASAGHRGRRIGHRGRRTGRRARSRARGRARGRGLVARVARVRARVARVRAGIRARSRRAGVRTGVAGVRARVAAACDGADDPDQHGHQKDLTDHHSLLVSLGNLEGRGRASIPSRAFSLHQRPQGLWPAGRQHECVGTQELAPSGRGRRGRGRRGPRTGCRGSGRGCSNQRVHR